MSAMVLQFPQGSQHGDAGPFLCLEGFLGQGLNILVFLKVLVFFFKDSDMSCLLCLPACLHPSGSVPLHPLIPVSSPFLKPCLPQSWHFPLYSAVPKSLFFFSHFLPKFKLLFSVVSCPLLSLVFECLILDGFHNFKCCWGQVLLYS